MTRVGSFLAAVVLSLFLAGCVNPTNDMAELRANPEGELAQKTMILTLPDGEVIPVNFIREGNKVYIGADGRWWRQLRGEGARVGLFILGEELTGVARAVEEDKEQARFILEKVRPGFAWLSPSIPIEITIDG